jgi:hypothetical protein
VNGVLYGFVPTIDAIVTINTSTSAATQVQTYSLPNDDVYASTTIPTAVLEPSSVALVALDLVAGGALGLVHRRTERARAVES